jgi:quercetin dioxygenase-like cupin family protein
VYIVHLSSERALCVCADAQARGLPVFVEGSVVMQLRGGEETTLTPGQTFHEGPNDVHVVSRNASATEPAKFVVFFVKDIGAPVLLPAN